MPHLEFPNLSHKQTYLEMMGEWREFEPTPTSPGRLFTEESFEEFIDALHLEITDNPHGVNSHLFFFIENERILGAIQIRHHINHPNLIETGGHIGYGIRPTERGKGYATEMLHLALVEAKKLGLNRVLITCYDENIPSIHVIEKNGGVFERYAEKDGKKMRRYWITMN